jgi:hypothetical protein
LVTVATLRRRYRETVRENPDGASLVFYHQSLGTDLFLREEAELKRILWLHETPPTTQAGTERLARAVDAFWFDRESWHDLVASRHQWIPASRLRTLRWIDDWQSSETKGELSPAPVRDGLRLGWVGDFNRAVERIDRLPGFLEELTSAGFAGKVELCGVGKLPPKIERACGRSAAISVTTFPLEAWHERLPAWTGMFALGRDFSWRIPYLAFRQRGLPLWLPVDGEVRVSRKLESPTSGIHFYEQGKLAEMAVSLTSKRPSGVPKPALVSPKIDWAAELSHLVALRTVARRPLRPSGAWPYGWIQRLNRTLSGEA